MERYCTLRQAAQDEIVPMLGELAEGCDVSGLAAEVFTLDPVSGRYTHTGEGITDDMLDRHAY